MTEEQIRTIVREEIELAAIEIDGLYDGCRKVAFEMVRTVFEMQAKQTIKSFELNETEHKH